MTHVLRRPLEGRSGTIEASSCAMIGYLPARATQLQTSVPYAGTSARKPQNGLRALIEALLLSALVMKGATAGTEEPNKMHQLVAPEERERESIFISRGKRV